jgi:phage protein D
MADAGTNAFYPSRPKISIAGREVPELAEGLLEMSIEETTAGLFSCEASFGNWGPASGSVGFLYFDRRVIDFGAAMTIVMGDSATVAPVFEGRITAIEGRFPQQRPPALQVLAEDRCQDLRMVRRTRTFEDVKDEDVFRDIASEHGMTPQLDIDGPTYKTLAQVNQSDLAFLRDRARAIDAEVWVEGKQLFAQARTRRKAGTALTLTYGHGLREVTATADLAHQRTKLAIAGWDVAAKEAIDETADEAEVRNELGGRASGSSVLSEKFGDRPDRIVHMVPLTGDEAKAVAAARYRDIARKFLTAEAIAVGDARLKVATEVNLAGLGPLFDGPWYVSAVRHTFDARQGYMSRFCCERAGLGTS